MHISNLEFLIKAFNYFLLVIMLSYSIVMMKMFQNCFLLQLQSGSFYDEDTQLYRQSEAARHVGVPVRAVRSVVQFYTADGWPQKSTSPTQ